MKVNQLLRKWLPASNSRIEEITLSMQSDLDRNWQDINKVSKSLGEMKEDISCIFNRLDTLQETLNTLMQIDLQNDNRISELIQRMDELSQEMSRNLTDIASQNISQTISLQKDILDEINNGKLMQELSSSKKATDNKANEIIKMQREILWSAVFNNTISDSPWLINHSFSPGRWALGYPALYILYRVLEQFKPHHILELGLGQSTKMITQYVGQDKEIEHFVVEHDHTWIDFFQKTTRISSNTHIVCLDREFVPYKDAKQVRVYTDFKNVFEKNKFDFILVDAPLGGDMKKYSRIDILSLLDDNLCEEFVLILDDTNRLPEQNTMKEISNHLDSAGIEYCTQIYRGEKETCIWASPTWAFLCSL